VHEREPFWFQVAGADPEDVAVALRAVTDTGNVPEPLRLGRHLQRCTAGPTIGDGGTMGAPVSVTP
jgi:hypothetical protein